MNLSQRVIDYLLITGFVWGMYLIWLIPFMLFWVQIEWDEFVNWLVVGTIFEMMFTYPIAKAVSKYSPKITHYVEEHV